LTPEIVFRRGKKDLPFVVFIHGLGMSHRMWTAPEQEKIFFGRASLKLLLWPDPPKEKTAKIVVGSFRGHLRSPFHILEREGFSLLAYSQIRPAAKIEVLIEELNELLVRYKSFCQRGLVFICHSRGGLIFRAYLQKFKPSFPVLAFFSLSCPHKGSNLAKMANKIQTIMKPLNTVLKEEKSDEFLRIPIRRIVKFLSSEAIKELLPESELIRSLDAELVKNILTFSFAGNLPRLLKLYIWNKNCLKYDEFLNLPDFLTSKFKGLCPEEMVIDKGDGLVSVRSAALPYSREFHTYRCNHAEIIYEKQVHNQILRIFKEEI